MLFSNHMLQGYKYHVILFIDFSFVEGVTIIYWLSTMKLYVSDIEKSYKNTVIGHLGNSGTTYLSLHIVQCWSECAVDEENRYLHMVMYCSHRMYKYYSLLGFFQ